MELNGTQTLVFLLQWFHCLMTYRPACVSEGLCHFSPSTSGACYWNSCSILPKGMCKCVIYKSGTARMVSGYQDTKDAFKY